jgi:hypothetical protein
MATYVPSATDTTQPTGDKKVASAPPEFRALKTYAVGLGAAVDVLEDDVDNIEVELTSISAAVTALLAAVGAGDNSVALAANLANLLDSSKGSHLVAFKAAVTGSVGRMLDKKLTDWLDIKDFGAIGTANPANVTADTIALVLARAVSSRILIPPGDFYFSSQMEAGSSQSIKGSGEGITRIHYTGAGNAAYLGGPGATTLIYNSEITDLTILCTNRGAGVGGVYLDNAVYFNAARLSVFGSGSPNDPTPANRVLYGAGLVATNNSIIGKIDKVSCRLWEVGYYLHTLPALDSFWSAAIVLGGQGELGNNMVGIRIGNPAVTFGTATNCAFRDLTLQGNYTCGVQNYSGDSTNFDTCYFEGNANYDYLMGGGVGNPVMNRIQNCIMTTEDIGVTPYGNFPYIAKIRITEGDEAQLVQNNCGITGTIPLIIVDAAANDTAIVRNRLASLSSNLTRISNASLSTFTQENYPENPHYAVGHFTRNMGAASGNQVVTGVGFRPDYIDFTWGIIGGSVQGSGTVGVGNGIVSRAINRDNSSLIAMSNACVLAVTSGANKQEATLTALGLDGFTLAFVLTGAPGGNDLEVNWTARRRGG